MTWDEYHLSQLDKIASKSKDPSTVVGALIVGPGNETRTSGFNGFPRGVVDDAEMVPERYERPAKYLWTEHAERNAIYNASRHGVALAGCTIYVSMYPCADCARAVIQAGISRVVTKNPEAERWESHYEVSQQMLEEAGVEVCLL